MKRIRLVMLLMMLLTSLNAWCYDFEVNGIYYNIISDAEVEVTYRSLGVGENYISLTIPSEVAYNGQTYKVTCIGDCAFEDCCKLVDIFIPNSITSIGRNAFMGCSSLPSEDGYVYAGNVLVSANTSSATFNIKQGTRFICCDPYLSGYNENITSVNLPNSVIFIGDYAFENCQRLQNISIPESVMHIGNGAFRDCTSLLSITIPQSVKYIGDEAFYGCTSLSSVNIQDAETSIGLSAFSGCSSLTNLEIPNSVTVIKVSAFNGCTSLPSSNGYVYAGCALIRVEDKTVTETNIKEGTKFICSGAFQNCKELMYVEIPKSVERMDGHAFWKCPQIEKIIINANTLITPGYDIASAFFDQDVRENAILYIPKESLDIYQVATESNSFNNPWHGFKNLRYIGQPEELEINDASGIAYKNNKEKEYSIIRYHRTFNNTNWQALYVPFSMSYDDWKNDFEVGLINDVNMYDTNDDGDPDITEVELFKIKKGVLKPNTPYFIKAKATGDKVITLENATLYPAASNSIDCSSTQVKFTFTGTYSGVSGADMYSNGYYALAGGSLCTPANSSVSLKPMRWYMNVESRGNLVINPANNVRIRVVGEDIDEDATGIADVEVKVNENATTYTLDGRPVNGNNLKPGMYIKNGKKIMIR